MVSFLESGKVALINRNYKEQLPKEGETWSCLLLCEKEKKAIVAPIKCVVSQEENDKQLKEKSLELVDAAKNGELNMRKHNK